jgi:hypothetical protein
VRQTLETFQELRFVVPPQVAREWSGVSPDHERREHELDRSGELREPVPPKMLAGTGSQLGALRTVGPIRVWNSPWVFATASGQVADTLRQWFEVEGHRPVNAGARRVTVVEMDDAQPSRFAAIEAEQIVLRADDLERLVYGLFEYITTMSRSELPCLVLHGGAVCTDEFTILVTGPSGAGKSTLTAALVASGFRYLADELVAIDPDDLKVWPLSRPIKLERRAVPLVTAVSSSAPIRGRDVHLVASHLGMDRRPGPPVGFVIHSSVAGQAPPAFRQMELGEALSELQTHRFPSGLALADQMGVLVRVADSAVSIRLARFDLDDAVRNIRETVATHSPFPSRPPNPS